MDLGFHDPGQVTHMSEGCLELVAVTGCGISRDEVRDARHHRAQFAQMPDSLMGPLGQIDGILPVEDPLDKSIQLLTAHAGKLAQICGSSISWQPGEPKRLAALLMSGQVVPQSLHQNVKEFVELVHALEAGERTAPQSLDDRQG